MVLKKAYIIGYPLEHSLSPAMHNAAYKELGLDYSYEKLELPELTAKNIDLLREPDCLGANVTIPHKKTAAKLLQSSAIDKLYGSVPDTGSLNTIVNFNASGRLHGHNTDGLGYMHALKEDNIILTGKKVILFGNGGAAQAIKPYIDKETKYLSIATRNSPRPDIASADIVINATPAGMFPKVNETILTDLSGIHDGQIFIDIVYNPRETLFLRNARSRGARVHAGWKMLLYQGAHAFHLLTGIPFGKIPVDIMRQTLLAKLA